MRAVAAVLVILLWPLCAVAQDRESLPAVLVADDLFITADKVLVARGNVEAFQGTVQIQAQEISYDGRTGRLLVTGPITLRDGEGITILASAAELDRDLQNGLLTGARLVLNQQLQLAAVQIDRVNGRYSQLYKSAATSCKVCADGRPPLWQLRAKRVVHDEEARQLYFDQAQFRIRNLPVFYFPRLRLPDPTLERATGFLIPSIRTTSQFGTGIKVPYFIRIGDSRDITLTPYLSPKTKTLEFRYRQAFARGRIEFDGALSRDEQLPGTTRGYLFGTGRFDLPRDFKLNFTLETTSDDAYLVDYGFSDKDRLESQITLTRTRRDEFIGASIAKFYSLREGDSNSTLPTVVSDALYEKRYFPARIGGEFRLNLAAHSHYRTSDQNIVGRDVHRINAEADWLRSFTLVHGVRAEALFGASGDFFDIRQDNTYPETQSQVTPHASIALRYPMSRKERGGAMQFLEPVLQVAWVDTPSLDLPNDESTLVEFDSGNLVSLSRFPRPDRRERGRVTALGAHWSRYDPDGLSAFLTLGRLYREFENTSFTESSGLTGARSSYLLAAQLKTLDGWAVIGRSIFDDSFDFSKAEVRGEYAGARTRLSTSYLWLVADLEEERDSNVSEISFDGSYDINPRWTAGADWRFDLADSRATTAGFGVSYKNECVSVDLSVQRRYTSSTSIEPSTSLGFTIGLRGFSAQKGTESYTRTCGK